MTSGGFSHRSGVRFRRNRNFDDYGASEDCVGSLEPCRSTDLTPPHTIVTRSQRNLLSTASLKQGLMQLPSAANKSIAFAHRTTRLTFNGIRYRVSINSKRISLKEKDAFLERCGSLDVGEKTAQCKAKRRYLRFWTIPGLVSVDVWSAITKQKFAPLEPKQAVKKPAQPWKVSAYSNLPLKTVSRWWGRINDIDLPVWARAPTYKLYALLFGVNLEEVAEANLETYSNLGEFFYRELKPGARPIDADAPLVSPADGTVVQMGIITDGQVEQVKGITYSLDAFLWSGCVKEGSSLKLHQINGEKENESYSEDLDFNKEVAEIDVISSAVGDFVLSNVDSVAADQGAGITRNLPQDLANYSSTSAYKGMEDIEMYYSVIYLAPGDYHRFHSPANWIAQLRRHFVGELYSVSPYIQNRLSNLFVLNERVALLGKWKYGFFSMTPVGATNVGSIRIHFDKNLATNTVFEKSLSNAGSTSSSLVKESKKCKQVRKGTCYEASYNKAGSPLGGHLLPKGEQMGGFRLGSTVVLAFEAPKNFQFLVKQGQRVKVGEALGKVNELSEIS